MPPAGGEERLPAVLVRLDLIELVVEDVQRGEEPQRLHRRDQPRPGLR
jgi:hypothetical protein